MVFDINQYGDFAFIFLKIVLGVIFIYHSLPKLKNPSAVSQAVGLSKSFVFILGLVELLAPLGIIFGFCVQISAFLLVLVMIGAIYFKTMKWKVPFSAMDKMGWEFDLILLAVSLFIALSSFGVILIP